MCHVSHVTCHLSRVTCRMSFFFLFSSSFFLILKKIGQGGGASRWRVCYQRGLPRLVLDVNTNLGCPKKNTIYLYRGKLEQAKRGGVGGGEGGGGGAKWPGLLHNMNTDYYLFLTRSMLYTLQYGLENEYTKVLYSKYTLLQCTLTSSHCNELLCTVM